MERRARTADGASIKQSQVKSRGGPGSVASSRQQDASSVSDFNQVTGNARSTLGVISVLGRLLSRNRSFTWNTSFRSGGDSDTTSTITRFSHLSRDTYLKQRSLVRQVSEPTPQTYQLGPQRAFPEDTVKRIIELSLEQNLKDCVYDVDLIAGKTKTLADLIKARVKRLSISRFKIICVVTMGKIRSQDVAIASRCLLDTEVDKFVSGTFHNVSLYAVATVYGIYHE